MFPHNVLLQQSAKFIQALRLFDTFFLWHKSHNKFRKVAVKDLIRWYRVKQPTSNIQGIRINIAQHTRINIG